MWIYSPLSVSVQEQEVSTSELEKLWAEMFEQSATWNTKLLPQRSWLRVFKTNPWIMRLFGQTCTPLMVSLGAKKWMESLEDIHVNHSPLQEKEKELKTPDIYGHQLKELSQNANQAGCSLKMWQDIFGLDISMSSSQALSDLVTNVRREYSQRKKLALPTEGKDSSSLQWTTPTARSWKGAPTKDTMIRKDGKSRMDRVESQAVHLIDYSQNSHQNYQKKMNGKELLTKDRTSHRLLNPAFTEWLMGWKVGWTSLAPLD